MFGFLEKKTGLAVRHQNGTLTYAEFNRILGLAARYLRNLGLDPGDRVATILPNSLELLACYYACILEGLVIVPINERMTEREISPVLAHSEAEVLLTTPDFRERFARLFSAGSVRVETLNGIHEWGGGASGDDGDTLGDVPPPTGVTQPWPVNQPAILFYTSGSTGAPKGVLYTHQTLIDNGRVFGNGLDVTSSDHSVLCHCMSSNFMFSQVTVPFLDRGGTVEIVDFGSVDQTLSAIESGATFLSLIPWFGFQLIEEGRARPRIPNSIRVSEVGADRVPMSYFRGFKEVFGVLPREHLGMAEANTYSINPPEESEIRLGSVGKLMAEVEVEIRDPSGQALATGAEGEIWVKTPGRMEGYWKDPEKTRETIVQDWLATGDAGYMDDDGFLWLSGRIKQIIICDGDNIHPREVEEEIAEHPLVERACVFGLPHPRRGATVAAAVVLTDSNQPLTLAALSGFLEGRVTEVKIPKDLLVLEGFPETPQGKLDRKAMAEMVGRQA